MVEVGGSSTLAKSIRSVGLGGQVVLIGVVGGAGPNLDPQGLRGRGVVLRSVTVGNRRSFEAMNRAIDVHRMRPLIDRVFSFDEAKEAYRYMESRKHFGKIVISGA